MGQKKKKSVPVRQKQVQAVPLPEENTIRELRLDFELIRFDTKAWIFLSICLAAYIVFVSLKWHSSSIAVWNTFVDDGGDLNRGILAGKPRPIRSDEWQVYASFVLAQEKEHFPLENPALGYGKTPLTFGVPTHHIVSWIKPSLWGYYFLDIERAFSWHWNFKLFPFLIASFLLLMLFTRNHFVWSVVGSVWLLFSSAIQWWSVNTEIFTYGIVSVIGFLYILFGKKPYQIITGGLAMMIAGFSFSMVLYPAYQVPYAYALVALIAGFCIAHRKTLISTYQDRLGWRVIALAAGLMGIGLLLFLFFGQAKETIDVISNTIYPGKRSVLGGNFHFTKFFADNFSFFMSEEKYPAQWLNICELSSFQMLSLLPAMIIVVESVKRKKFDPILISAIVFLVILLVWILVGFPEILAKWTFLSTSPSYRAFYIFGFFNVIVAILFLTRHRISVIPVTWLARVISFLLILGGSYLIHNMLNTRVTNFFSTTQVWIATLLYAGLNWLILFFNHGKTYQTAFYILLGLALIPNLRINPLCQGLAPFFENQIYQAAADIESKDPGARWVVYGRSSTPNFIKAAGVNCFNGVQFAPPLEELRVLDPKMENDSVYNRFAHIGFTSLIQPNDSFQFELKQNDLYMIRMDPCSPRLTTLGIKYVMFTYDPHPFEITCMTHVVSLPNHHIYKRNDL